MSLRDYHHEYIIRTLIISKIGKYPIGRLVNKRKEKNTID